MNYGAYKNVWKKSKGHNLETKKGGTIVHVHFSDQAPLTYWLEVGLCDTFAHTERCGVGGGM